MSQKIFIIHGWGYTLDKWQKIMPLLQQKGLDPVLLKVPGLTLASDQVWDINGYVNWLEAELKGQDRPVVIGHSNGGRIALSYLQTHPQAFKRLVLVDSAGMVNDSILRGVKLKILLILSKIGKPLAHIPIVNKVFYRIIGAQDYKQASPSMRLTMQNMLKADKLIDFAKVQVPVTLIWGSDDTLTPVSDGKKMQALLPASQLHIVPGGRHSPQDTHAAEVARLIEQAVKD